MPSKKGAGRGGALPGGMQTIRVVAGVLIRDGKVLAARRPADKRLGGFWELPGGKLEEGESHAEALVRELREELGVAVLVDGHVGVASHGEGPQRIELVALACRLETGEPVALEHSELRWLGPDELHAVDWAPADLDLLPPVRNVLRGIV